MESRKNVLGKLLMKEKELFLSTKYSIFGRNETLWFAKDLIIFLNKQNVNIQDKEDFAHYKVSDSSKVSRNAFLIIQNENAESFLIYNLSKNNIIVDNFLLKQYESSFIKHKSTIMLHNISLVLIVSKNLIVKAAKQNIESSNNLLNSNQKGNNSRKLGYHKMVKPESKPNVDLDINLEDYRIKSKTYDNTNMLQFLKYVIEKPSVMIKTEKVYFENNNGKGAFKNNVKSNGKTLLNTKRKASLPLLDKKELDKDVPENDKILYDSNYLNNEINKNTLIKEENGIKIE